MKLWRNLLALLAVFALVAACDDGEKKKKAVCGNNILESGETCDGTALGGATCADQGFDGGELGCLANCEGFDTSGCTNGNNNNTNNTNNTTPGYVGDPCRDDEQCVSTGGFCADEVGYGMPSGYCLAECSSDADCTEENTTCLEDYGICVKTCTLGGNDCRNAYECLDIGEAVGVCWAACQNASDCPTTGICNAEEGFCVVPPEQCTGGQDEDMDGKIDCDDEDCSSMPECGCSEDTLNNHSGTDAYTLDVSTLPASIQGYICGPANEDWFRIITPAAGFSARIRLALTHSVGDLDLYLTNDAFSDLAHSWTTSDLEEITYTLSGGTTYYIRVEGYSGAIGAYTLTVDYAPAEIEAVVTPNPAQGAPGGTVNLNVTLNNVGGLIAANVTAQLTTTDADVSIVDGAASFGDIAVGASANNTADALTFAISANHKNNQPVELTLEVADANGGAWSFPVSVPVPYALLVADSLAINDTTGNNDHFIDPGETADLAFNVRNNGGLAATGPVSVAVSVDASSTAAGTTITAPTNTVCSATDLAAGATAACNPWTLAVPASASNGQTIVLNFTFTSGGDTWTDQKTITVGPSTYQSILTSLDPVGDNGNYACDLRDVLVYVDASNVLHVKTTFASACNLTGIHDIYISNGTTAVTLTLENNAKSIWSNSSGSWTEVSAPASFTITPLSGSSAQLEYAISVNQIPTLTFTGNTMRIFAAVIASWSESDYNDYAPDSVGGAMPWVDYTW